MDIQNDLRIRLVKLELDILDLEASPDFSEKKSEWLNLMKQYVLMGSEYLMMAVPRKYNMATMHLNMKSENEQEILDVYNTIRGEIRNV